MQMHANAFKCNACNINYGHVDAFSGAEADADDANIRDHGYRTL